MAARPRPMTAPAVIIAPQIARMVTSSRVRFPGARSAPPTRRPRGEPRGRDGVGPAARATLHPEHLHAAAENQQQPTQDDEQAATAAARPGPELPPRVEHAPAPAPAAEETAAAEQWTPARTH